MDVHAQEEWIVVGKFGQVHGIKGLIKVISFTEPRENILNYEPWFIKNKTSWQSIEINQALTHTKDILVGIKGYAEREDVAVLTNQEIAVPKSALPLLASDEYYWHELVGMRVIQRDQTELGMVVEIIATGSNDVLIVTSDHGTQRYLIPYLVDEVIIEVSRPKRCITVDWDLDF